MMRVDVKIATGEMKLMTEGRLKGYHWCPLMSLLCVNVWRSSI